MMIYSKLYLKNKPKIPNIISFLLIFLIILIFVRIFSGLTQPSKAANIRLKRLEITNISASSATIFWQTEKKEVGWLIYGDSPTKINKIALDERDLPSQKKPHFYHYVTIRELKENKKYFFKIVSNNKLIGKKDDIPFDFIAHPKIEGEKKSNLGYGRVVKENNTPLEGAVVLLSLADKVIASTLTKLKGEWLIPLNFKVNSSEKIKIEIISEDNQISTIYTDINKISPLPQTIIIGRNYDFTQENNVLSAASPDKVKGESNFNFDIIYPKEKASIPGRTPIIKGSFFPETIIYITIKPKKTIQSAKTYSAQIISDKKGFWSFSPSQPLSLGEYILTAIAKDKNGKELILERNFTVIGKEASNVDVLGEATPSATIVPSPTLLTPIPTETTLSPTPPTSGIGFVLPALFGVSFFILGLGIILVF